MNDVLKLYTTTYEKNKYGVPIPCHPEPGREVFCDVRSVTRAEFFEAGRNGLNPQFVFIVFKGDYENETICEYNGETYAIYRTYITDDDYIELYVERKGGTNGEESNN